MNGGEAIKYWRKTVRSMTIQQFAGEMECSTSTVGKWENGEIREPPRSTAARIDDVLDAGGAILSAYGYGAETQTEISELRSELAELRAQADLGRASLWEAIDLIRGEAERGRGRLWEAIDVIITTAVNQKRRHEIEDLRRAGVANGGAPPATSTPQRARRRG